MSVRESSADIDTAAADWAVRVDGGRLDGKAQAALDAWLAGDSRRLGAYARARAVFAHARRAKALGAHFDPDAYAAADSAAPNSLRHLEAEREVAPDRRRFLAWTGSAAVAVAVGAIALSWPAAAQTYRTVRGEVRRVPLEDGSAVTLNTATEIRVRFRDGERRIELVEGEALFDVARDPSRPFVVLAGEARVRALGTSFTVRNVAQQPVEVLVRQGEVEIARPSAPPLRVPANVRAIAAPRAATVATPLAPAQVGRALAWREGMLAFEDMPLEEAAAEFARYSGTPIRFADPAIGRETVTGLYAANNPRGFARSAALSLGLRAESRADAVVLAR